MMAACHWFPRLVSLEIELVRAKVIQFRLL